MFIRNSQMFPLWLYHALLLSMAANYLNDWVDHIINQSLLLSIKLFPIIYYYKQFGNECHCICSFVHTHESICRITFIGKYILIFDKHCPLVLHIDHYQLHS